MDANRLFLDIMAIANAAAEKIANDHKGKAIEEFLVWFKIGIERETLVAEAYGNEYIIDKISGLQVSPQAKADIKNSIQYVWTQENQHKIGVVSALDIIDPAESVLRAVKRKFNLLLSELKGIVFGNLLTANPIRHYMAKIAVVIGQQVADLPAFIVELEAGTFQENCLVNMALEFTAIKGYERMLALIPIMEQERNRDFSHQPLEYMLKHIRNEEWYHYELFKYYSKFPPVTGRPFSPGPNDPGGPDDPDDPARSSPSPDSPDFERQLKADLKAIVEKTLSRPQPGILSIDEQALKEDKILRYMHEYFNPPPPGDQGGDGGESAPIFPREPRPGKGYLRRKRSSARKESDHSSVKKGLQKKVKY